MTFREIFESELRTFRLKWCHGGCCATQSHRRGFVLDKDKTTVHLESSFATRSSLHRGFHEIAHCILPERDLRRYEKEAQANRWAEDEMRRWEIQVPSKTMSICRAYERRMKSWGDNIRRAGR